MTTLAFGLDAVTYLAFYGAAAMFTFASGPNTMYVLARDFGGRGPDVWSALGIATGVLSYILLATVGTATLFRTVPGATTALKYAGAAYLGYLDVTSLRNDEFDPSVETDAGASLRHDILANTLNPKVALSFLVFLPGSIGQGTRAGARMASLGAAYAALTALYLSVVALGVNQLGSKLAEMRTANAPNYVSAGTALLLGAALALE